MTDGMIQILGPVMTLLGIALTVWGSIRVGRNASRAQSQAASQEHELGLIDRYKILLEETEQRLTARVDGLQADVQRLQDEVHEERTGRRTAESQRDAAVQHAQELRDAWPGSTTVPSPPPIIAQLLTLGTHHQPPERPGASS